MKAEAISKAQGIPVKFLLNILSELKHARLVQSHRGAEGGYALARPADEITIADVIRAVEGPLANVHEARPEEITYSGSAEQLSEVWIAVRASLRPCPGARHPGRPGPRRAAERRARAGPRSGSATRPLSRTTATS